MVIEIGDTVKVGDEIFIKTENGVTKQKVKLEEKNYMRGGVEAKIAKLNAKLAEYQAILAEIENA